MNTISRQYDRNLSEKNSSITRRDDLRLEDIENSNVFNNPQSNKSLSTLIIIPASDPIMNESIQEEN
jgi:hypothetical protein